ncbi:MAG TPA: class I SAM-dependent methyltransferase [Baekduia sp.]|nr:class I SAM-dependent methyltransferase [Baekduia sp.]
MSDAVNSKVQAHWSSDGLRDRVADVLKRAGKDSTNTTVEDLSPLDQWHVEGLLPTQELAELAGVKGTDEVLDAGCGMGGPARYLARTYGCNVRGVDMSRSYLDTAAFLNEITGLESKVSLEYGDVCDLSLADESVDVAWTQHAVQSVPDKARFFAEVFRVLKPGGRFVVHDLYRDSGSPVHYPAFWGDESISFLETDAEMRSLLEGSGFEVVHWKDRTASARATIEAMSEEHATTDMEHEPIEGLDALLIFDADIMMEMAENSVKDFAVGSVGIFEAVVRKS